MGPMGLMGPMGPMFMDMLGISLSFFGLAIILTHMENRVILAKFELL
jgi:hypothetical protein